jgi:transposase-like protein
MTERRGRKRHSPEQVITKLREADAMLATGSSMGQVCQRLEVAEQTYYRWRNQYGGMKSSEAKRLKDLETENTRLKKLLAEAQLDKQILKEALDFLGKA